MNGIAQFGRFGWALVVILMAVMGCTATAPPASAPPSAGRQPSQTPLVLPALDDPAHRDYLGIETTGDFEFGQIQTQVLIIEVFSMYCPHCQREAPNVNQLYRSITNDPDLKNRIKLIGIGASNTHYEVQHFRESFDIPFPLFPDRSRNLARQLDVRQTPTFIGFVWEDGIPRRFLHAPGRMGKTSEFLARVVRMANLETAEP